MKFIVPTPTFDLFNKNHFYIQEPHERIRAGAGEFSIHL